MKAFSTTSASPCRDLSAALAFYRDALGFERRGVEDVASQRVRAHFIPVGDSSLELLEATAPDSPIARYLDKRGPGLHHITLARRRYRGGARAAEGARRPADRRAAAARRRAGALVAFIHPSSAHGVLVELKQPASTSTTCRPLRHHPLHRRRPRADLAVRRLPSASMAARCSAWCRRPLWSAKVAARRVATASRWRCGRCSCAAADDADRRRLGDKESEKFYRHLRRRPRQEPRSRAGGGRRRAGGHRHRAGDATCTSITPAASRSATPSGRACRASHAPATSCVAASGKMPRITHERNRGQLPADNFVPLADAGVLDAGRRRPDASCRACACSGPAATRRTTRSSGSNRPARRACSGRPDADHRAPARCLDHGLRPLSDGHAGGQEGVRSRGGASRQPLVFFEHDPVVPAGFITEQAAASWRLRPTHMSNPTIGIIGGSGLYDMAELTDREERVITTPFGDPSGPYVIGDAARQARRVPGPARRRPPPAAVRAELPRQHLRLQDARRRAHPLGQRRRQPEGGVPAARHRRARPVLRSDQGPHQHLLRPRHRGARRLRAPGLRATSRRLPATAAEARRRHASIAAAPT